MKLWLLAGWTWAGFLLNPPPAAPPAPPPAPAPAPAPARPPTWFVAADGQWHGRDRTGQEWAHPDRSTLADYLSKR